MSKEPKGYCKRYGCGHSYWSHITDIVAGRLHVVCERVGCRCMDFTTIETKTD